MVNINISNLLGSEEQVDRNFNCLCDIPADRKSFAFLVLLPPPAKRMLYRNYLFAFLRRSPSFTKPPNWTSMNSDILRYNFSFLFPIIWNMVCLNMYTVFLFCSKNNSKTQLVLLFHLVAFRILWVNLRIMIEFSLKSFEENVAFLLKKELLSCTPN